MARAPKTAHTKVVAIRHKDRRANIPAEELRDFEAEDEQAPKTMLYPRDPFLDPQLFWQGKDERDRADLAVPVVPIYIQKLQWRELLRASRLLHRGRGTLRQAQACPPRRDRRLLRVVVDETANEIAVITVYKTSQIGKYLVGGTR